MALPRGDELKHGKVIGQSKDSPSGQVIGDYHDNPLLNTISYDIKFLDGTVREYRANVIAQNIYQQVNSNGHHHYVLDAVLNHS